jgi:hypothetical protein
MASKTSITDFSTVFWIFTADIDSIYCPVRFPGGNPFAERFFIAGHGYLKKVQRTAKGPKYEMDRICSKKVLPAFFTVNYL